jgi:predicted nucleic acid-binding protein
MAAARAVLAGLNLVRVDDRLLDAAAVIDPAILRSLDAIHLAAALSLGDDLTAVVSYDLRVLEGAQVLGLPTARPT